MSRRPLLLTVLLLLAALAAPCAAQDPDTDFVVEIETLLAFPEVVAALDHVVTLDPWGVETLRELTEIPAPPFQETLRGARFAELLSEAGADSVWIDAEGNVLGQRRGTRGRRTVSFGGHLDTVFPEGTDVTVRQRGDTLFAPGIGDDTRGLVVVLTVLRALSEADLRTEADLLFVGTVGEEGLGDLRGMKRLFAADARPIDAWIEIDGGGLDRIVNQGLGSVRYRVTYESAGGHSWGAFGRVNPAHALGTAIAGFQAEADVLTRTGPRTSYNVGRVGGGTSVNSIPFEAWMEVDMRSEDPAALSRVEATLLAAVQQALERENSLLREGAPLEVDIEKIGDRPSGALDPTNPLVQRALAATLHFGGTPELVRSSTNANTPIALGVPAVTLGRGGLGGEAHAPGEWWLNQDGHVAIQRALVVLLAEAGLAAQSPRT